MGSWFATGTEARNELKVAASNTLVTLARCYFSDVMLELVYHLGLPEEFIFITLGNLSSAYALKCIPFVGMILNDMISMLALVKDSRMRQAFCGVLEKCSRAVNGYFMNWEKCSFPRMGESQFCKNILPLYCHVTSNWLTCEELELKQAIIKALGPMMGILLHKKEPQNPIFEAISWLLEQYKEKIDVFHVTKCCCSHVGPRYWSDKNWTQDTKESRSAQAGMAAKGSRGALQAPAERLPVLQDSEASRTVAAADPQPPNARDGGETPESLRLPAAEERVGSSLGGRSIDPLESLSQLLEVSVEYKIPLPKGKFQAICSALHNQICSPAKQLSIENHQELFHCVLLLARSSPDDLLAFLHEQLEIEHEAVRVASLDFLRAIVGADLPETRVKKLLIVKAVKYTLSDQNATRTEVPGITSCGSWSPPDDLILAGNQEKVSCLIGSVEARNELKVAASNTLVTLARCYFSDVMLELVYHLGLPEEFIFITLGNLSSAYALKCIPFVGMILNDMISMLALVKDSRMRQAFCGVLEKCSRAVNGYFMNWEKCSFPRMGESQFCKNILPLYCHVTSNWLTCEELELKQAIIKALGPMMGILLHKKEPQNPIFEAISWLLEQYKEKIDVFHVTKCCCSHVGPRYWSDKSLSQLLEVSVEYKIPLPKGKFQAICSALHNQICSPAKQLSIENHQELFHCVLLLARSSPDDLLAFLHEQLEIEHEAVRVASLDFLRAIVGADLPETRVKKLLIVKAVKYTLSDQNATRIYHSSQFSIIRKFAESAIHTILQIIYEDIEQNRPQDRPLGYST
ncbi:unnamed protein product [Lepidochelys olivacea]